MKKARIWKLTSTRCILTGAALVVCGGCRTSAFQVHSREVRAPSAAVATQQAPSSRIQLASHQEPPHSYQTASFQPATLKPAGPVREPGVTETAGLTELEDWALTHNPALLRMHEEAAAEWAKTGYVSKLPDPSIGTRFFTPPMSLEPDRQVAEVSIMQMIPWLGRLEAQAQQAHMDALAAANQYHAERLRVIGDLRVEWSKLYVLARQIETAEADQAQLEALISTANARVATGAAQPGDVLMATLELSSLQEQLINYRQQVATVTAEINRLAGRDVSQPVHLPVAIALEPPPQDFESLRRVAFESQPELNAARLRTAATRWGLEIARLNRRPDLTFGFDWIVMDAPGATMPDAGADTFTLGVTATIPIWSGKYEAMASEAAHRHYAAHASETEVALRIDSVLRDLLAQAEASRQTIELYEKTILPQARQTFESDLKSLTNNTVSFERVIADYRKVLNLELGYHRARGQLATVHARIRQTVGDDVPAATPLPTPESAPPGQG